MTVTRLTDVTMLTATAGSAEAETMTFANGGTLDFITVKLPGRNPMYIPAVHAAEISAALGDIAEAVERETADVPF